MHQKYIFKCSLEVVFFIPDPEIWHDGGNRGDNSCMTLNLKTKHLLTIYDDVIIPSRHASKRQRPIFSVSYGLSQWNVAFGDIFCCLLVILHQKGKMRHGSSNDDVINLTAMIER